MKLRLAAFNVNNLFSRPRVLELPGFSKKARAILDDVSELSALLERRSYAGRTGDRIHAILEEYDVGRGPQDGWFGVQQVRGQLFAITKGGVPRLVARGRADWVGWVELARGSVAGAAVDNTARVLSAVDADVVCVSEVEDRATLDRFNRELLADKPYAHSMSIEGNDARGINVGMLTRFPIRSIRSHVDDTVRDASGAEHRIFSRDCPRYELSLPGGQSLWAFSNHLKSKGYGDFNYSDELRRRQARRIRDLVSGFDLTRDWVVVAGDLNDLPDSEPLRELLETPHLRNVLDHLPAGEPRWTYRDGRSQIDYLLVSRPLFERVAAAGIERRGMWHRTGFAGAFPSFSEVTDTSKAASDHAAVWVDLDAA